MTRARVLAMLLALLACGSQEASLGNPSGARVGPTAGAQDIGPVSGALVHPHTLEPLAGRTILVGAQRTTSDARGRFTVERVPGTYDVTVVEGDRTIISIYKGLSRRDPTLIHRTTQSVSGAYHAVIRGKLAGGGAYPLPKGHVSVGFVPRDPPVVVREATLGEQGRGRPEGPTYDGVHVNWSQPGPVVGELTAIRLSDYVLDPKGGVRPKITKVSWSFGHRSIELSDGDHLVADLELVPVPTVHVTVQVDAADGHSITWLGQRYRTPSLGFVLNVWHEEVNHSSLSYETEIADLRAFGASLCTSAGSWNSSGWQSTDTCSHGLDQVVGLRLERAPTITSPANDVVPTPATKFAWTAFHRGIHVLTLEPWTPTEFDPAIYVYTSATSSPWPDVTTAGVLFPEGPAIYNCTIRGLGPYTSMDDAVGPDGVGSGAFMERQTSDSAAVLLKFPPPASKLPPCDAPPSIACGPRGTEAHSLQVMNRMLRVYPRFAAASGLRCVRDCEGARAWTKASDAYRRSHPGFTFDWIEDATSTYPPPEPPPIPSAPAPAPPAR